MTERRIDSIEPVDAAEVVLERAIHVGLAQAERDDGLAGADGERHLVRDLVGAVRLLRVDEYEDVGRLDRLGDRRGPALAGQDVARGVPALNAVVLEVGDDRVSDVFVLGRIADENIMLLIIVI